MKSLESIATHFICPHCKHHLQLDSQSYKCSHCEAVFPVHQDRISFLPPAKSQEVASQDGILFRMKQWIKQQPWLYRSLLFAISPVMVSNRRLNRLLREMPDDALIVHLGSGPNTISPKAWNLDIHPYPNVDISCDAHRLPLQDNTADLIVNIVVLEHVTEPDAIIAEMHRVLKPGGKIFTVVPFLQCYHDSPHDYRRWTHAGISLLHQPFHELESGPVAGPGSALCWTLQETLAILFSFGIRPLYPVMQILFMLLCFPIKFLDILLTRMPHAENAASVFYFLGEKKTKVETPEDNSPTGEQA